MTGAAEPPCRQHPSGDRSKLTQHDAGTPVSGRGLRPLGLCSSPPLGLFALRFIILQRLR